MGVADTKTPLIVRLFYRRVAGTIARFDLHIDVIWAMNRLE